MSLMKKGIRLREILLGSYENDNTVLSGSNIINVLAEISTVPIKIVDEKSAMDRIHQWKQQELLCDNFQLTAESYNLIHLMSLIKVYEDLTIIGEKVVPKNKNIKNWVIKFMRNALGINRKMEHRNRLGCYRLCSLFKQGITSEHLVRAGCHKCDFFVRKEDYEVFLSQIPSIGERSSISTIPTLSELVPDIDLNEFTNNSKRPRLNNDTKKVMFKLRLDDNLKEAVVNDEDSIYIE
jgi:hypothetical protein